MSIDTKETQVTVDTITSKKCDLCQYTVEYKYHDRFGESFPEHMIGDPREIASFEYRGGYSAAHLGDMTTVSFDLCDKCLMESIKKLGIKAKITEY